MLLSELVKFINSLRATVESGWREHGANDQIAMMHTDISRVKYVELPSEMWRSENPKTED